MSELTGAGKNVLKSAHRLLQGVDKKMTTDFDHGEIESLRSLLQRCTENMRVKR